MRSPIKFVALAAALLFNGLPSRVMAYTAQWTQFNWSAPSVSTAVHPGDTDGWTAYDAKSSTITYIPGTGLQFQNLYYNWTTTDDSSNTTGFRMSGSTWPASIPLSTGTNHIVLGPDLGNGADGVFNSATYSGGISGITGTAPNFAINTNQAGKLGEYSFSFFRLAAGHTITVSGANRLVLRSTSTIEINGTLRGNGTNSSSGTGAAGGPGGGAGGNAGQAGSGAGGGQSGAYSSGGGGYGGAGGNGYSMSTFYANGGPAYGEPTNLFTGGSGGGGSSGGYGGGGGGGFIVLNSTALVISATGRIEVIGGAGFGGTCNGGWFGAGGSGGAVMARAFSLSNSGVISAKGGYGADYYCGSYAGGAPGGGGGRVALYAAAFSTATGTVDVSGGSRGLCNPADCLSGNGSTGSVFYGSLSSGLYTSGVYDTGGTFDFYDISFSSSFPPLGGSLTVQVRAGSNPAPDGTWTSWAPYNSGDSLGGSMDYLRYIQWRASLTSTDISSSTYMYDLAIRYLGYDQAWNSLVSSVYDSGSSSNSLRMLRWGENAPFPTDARLQVRTSPDALTWTSWMGPDGTSSSWFTDPVGAESMPYPLRDGVGDRYFQYFLSMKGSGNNTPTVSVTTVTYGTITEPQLTLLTPQASHQLLLDFVDYSDDEDDFRISTSVAGDPINDVGPIATGNKPGTGAQSGVMSGLTPNTLYFIRLRAHENAKGAYSNFSNKISTYTLAAPPVPSTVPYSMSGGLMTVRWADNGNPPGTQYFPERATDPEFTVPVQPGWTTSTQQVFGGLSSGTTYYFRVRARNSYGIETATVALHAAQLVTDPAAMPISYVGTSSVTVNWGHNGNPSNTLYWVQRNSLQLKRRWAFEDSLADEIIATPFTTYNGPSYSASGKYGKSMNFNGASSQYIVSNANVGISGAAPRTLAFWIRPTNLGVQRDILGWGNSATAQRFGVMQNAAGQPYFWGHGADFTGLTVMSAGAWSHVAVTYDGITVRLYVNGAFDSSAALSLNTVDTPLRVGQQEAWGYFHGDLDDITIVDRMMSAGEIAQLHASRDVWIPASPTWVNGTQQQVEGLISNTTYNFRVMAANPSYDLAQSWVNLGTTMTLVNQPLYSAAMQKYETAILADWGLNGNSPDVPYLLQVSTAPDYSVLASSRVYIERGAWTSLAAAPAGVATGASGGVAMVYDGKDSLFAFRGNSTTDFWRYSITGNSWTGMQPAPGATLSGCALVHDGGDYIYALQGANTTAFWRYSISGNNWTVLPVLPGAAYTAHNPMVIADGNVYAMQGNNATGFYKYSPADNRWTTLASAPFNSYGALAYSGWGNYIYALHGGGNTPMYRYSILSNSWANINSQPAGSLYWGGGMASPGYGDYIYILRGSGSANLWRYSISGNNYASLADAPTTASQGAVAYAKGRLYALPGNNTGVFLRYTPALAAMEQLAPLTTYYARVSASNAVGNSTPWTDLGSARTLLGPPVFDGYADVQANQLTVKWINRNGAPAEVFVQRALDSGFTTGLADSGWLSSSISSQTFAGLGVSTQYYFRIMAREAATPSNQTAWHILPPQATLPNTPSPSGHTFVSSSSVSLAWTANGNGTGTQYYAERATDAGFTQNVGNSGWINHPTVAYNLTGLVPNTYYYIRVKARSASGIESGWAALPAVRTFANVPGSPSFSGVTGSQLQFDWTLNSNSAGTEFMAEISSAPVMMPKVALGIGTASNDGASHPFVLKLDNGRTRLYYARNLGTHTDIAYKETTDTNPISPSNLSAVNAVVGGVGNQYYSPYIVRLSDNRYRVYASRYTTGPSWFTVYFETTDTNPPSSGNIGAPTTVISEAVHAYTPSIIRLDNGRYRIYYGQYSGVYFRLAYRETTDTNLPVSGNLGSAVNINTGSSTADQAYVPRVIRLPNGKYRVYYGGGNTVYTSVFYKETSDTNPPDAGNLGSPVSMGIGSSASDVSDCVDISTVSGKARIYYGIHNGTYYSLHYREMSAGVNTAPVPEVPAFSAFNSSGWGTGTSYTASGLDPDTGYSLRVKARNAVYDEGINSLAPAVSSYTVVLSTITKVPPAVPTGLAVNLTGVSAAQSDRLHIEWLDNSVGEDGFKLEKSANGVSFGLLTTLGAGATEYIDTGLAPNTSYYYRVKAYSLAGGDSLYSGVGVLYTRAAAPHTPVFQQFSSVTARNSWNTAANPGWTQFTAEISSASDFSFISFSSVTALSPALYQGLIPNTSYYFRVRAANGDGVLTAYSAAANSLTSAAPPASPASLAVHYTSASFSWAANGNPTATMFGMEVSTASDFTGTLVSSATVLYSAVAEGLSPNVTYYMRVRALNMAYVPSAYVSPAAPVATLAMPPAASALPYTVNATSVTVHWATSGNSPHTQYNVQRSARDSSNFASVEDASLWQTGRSSWTFSAPSLVAGATYYFRIKARNSAGTESPSGATGWVVLPSTQTLPYLPGVLPQDVYVSSINARWINSNQAGTPYLAEAFSDAGFTTLVASSGWTSDIASYMFSGLQPNTRYFLRAAARNTSGLETARVLLYSEYTRAAQPGAPLSDYVRTGNSVTVSWDKSGNPDPDTEYTAVRSSASDFSAGLDNSAWISANSYQFNGLTAGTTYYFRVKARNRNALPLETGWSVLPSTVTLPAPEPPSGLVLSYPDADSNDRVSVGWNDNSSAESGFRVYESADGSVFTIKDTLGSNAGTGPLSYLSLGLSINARYYYKVAAFNANGESYSEVLSTYTRAALPSALPFTQVMTNSMRANWNTGVNPGGTQFHCELSTDAAFGAIAASTRTAGGTFLFTGLQANATHYGRVRAVNGSGVPTDYVLMGSSQTIPLSVTIAVSDPGPGPMNQGQRFSFAKLVVTPSGSGAVLSGIAVDRIGDGVDSDASRVGIWRDQNMDGSFQAGNDSEAGFGVFSSSRASVTLNETLTAPATFFVTITAADNYMSWPGYTIGAAIASTASFSSPNSVIASMAPQAFTGTAVPVTKIADVLDIFGQSVVSMPNVSRGVYNTAFLKLTMNANRDRAYLNSVALQKLGNLTDANIAAIKIFYDANKNGTLEALAGDPLVSSGVDAFSSGQAVVQFVNPSTRAVTNDVYFVTLDIIETAPLGATIGVRVPSAASFQLMAGTPDSVTLGSTPTDSAVPAVSDPPNSVFVTATPMGVAQVAQGESKALLKLELTADTGIAVVNLVKVQRSSSSLNSDYTGLSFYRDNAPLGEYGGSDTFIASGTVVSGQVNFGMAESITFTSTKTYFVVAHMSPSANVANQAGVLVQSGYITATSAQTTVVAGFPLNSGLAQITPTVDVVQVTPDASMAPGVAYQSDANVPILGLRFKALSNAADISSLMISQAGSAQDGDISALRLYRDNGDGTFNPGNDTPVSGAYALSNGTAAVSFSAIQNITTAESLYFIAADISASAVPGRSSQLRLLNAAAVNVLAPDVVSSTFPILSNVVNLEKLPAVVLVSTTGLAPAAAEAGTPNIKLVRIGLRSNQSTSQLNSLGLVRSGGGDADISRVALYWDANANALLEASELVSSGTFSGGILTLPFGGLARNLTVSTKTYYVTMDLSAAAPIGASLGVNFTNLSVQNPDTVEAGRLPFGSGGVLVAEPPAQLHSHFENMLPASITQGDRSVLVASMTLRAAAYTVSWNGIQLLRAGNGYDSDISAVRIYRDNGNGVWGGAAQETEIASGLFSAGALNLSFAAETIATAPLLYYVAVDVSETADPGKTFGINLPAASYMKMADPDYGDITDFPFSSSLASIAPTVDTLETVPVPLSLAPLLTQGDYRRSIGKLTLRAATNAVSISGIRFLQTGTMSDDSLAEAILYKDDGDGVYSQALDTPVTSPTGLSAGILQLAVSPAQVLGQASQTFWLAISVSSSAPVGTTFSLDCPSTSYFTVSNPDVVDASAFPFSFSLAGTLQDMPDQLHVRIEDRAPTSIYQGINATAMARLSFWASEDRVELNRVRVDLNGTVSQSDIARAVLYADSDGNRLLDPVYDAFAASGTFSAGSVWLTFGTPQVITPSTAVYFLAYDIAPAAVIGGEAGAGIMNAGYFDRSAPDTVAAVTSLQTRQAVIRDPRVPVPPGIAMLLADGKLTIEELSYAPYETMLDFKWSGTVYQGSLERVEYNVGAAPATGASAWTPAGLNKDLRITSLNLAHGATYYLSLRAKNALGAFYSDIVSQRFVVDSYKPLIPPGAQAREEAGGVKLTWPEAAVGPSGVAHYMVEERAAGSPVWVAVTTTSARSMVVSRTGISIQSAKPAGAYYYRVSPVNNAGVTGDPTEPLAVKIDIGSLASISGVSAYPNPFDSRKTQVTVAFTLNKASPVKLAIYDVFGVKVKELSASGLEGENLVRWDGSGASGKVSKGVYLCVIKAAGDSKLVKIAVKH